MGFIEWIKGSFKEKPKNSLNGSQDYSEASSRLHRPEVSKDLNASKNEPEDEVCEECRGSGRSDQGYFACTTCGTANVMRLWNML